MNILNDLLSEVERATPFEAAQDRANMFSVNMFLAHSMNECIKHGLSAEGVAQDLDQKMLLAAKTLEAMNVSA